MMLDVYTLRSENVTVVLSRVGSTIMTTNSHQWVTSVITGMPHGVRVPAFGHMTRRIQQQGNGNRSRQVSRAIDMVAMVPLDLGLFGLPYQPRQEMVRRGRGFQVHNVGGSSRPRLLRRDFAKDADKLLASMFSGMNLSTLAPQSHAPLHIGSSRHTAIADLVERLRAGSGSTTAK